MTGKPQYRMADCHPDRSHYGKGQCKQCYMHHWQKRNRTHINALKNGHYRRDPQRYLGHSRKSMYGITPEQHRDLLVGQAGRCLICGLVPDVLVIDHSHATGKVRGLLCHPCNKALAFLRDKPERARAAARYLEVAA